MTFKETLKVAIIVGLIAAFVLVLMFGIRLINTYFDSPTEQCAEAVDEAFSGIYGCNNDAAREAELRAEAFRECLVDAYSKGAQSK